MTFHLASSAAPAFLWRHAEMALGLGLILLLAHLEGWISTWLAAALLLLAIAARLPKILADKKTLLGTHIELTEQQIIEHNPEGNTEIALEEIKVLLYKRRGKKVKELLLVTEQGSLKLAYFDQMNTLFERLAPHAHLRKEVYWWQPM